MRRILTCVLLLLTGLMLGAQNVSDLIIGEALAEPDSTAIRDDYGRRNGWVELYNKSTGTVNFGGCFLTDDRTDLRKSLIPKSDLRTKLGPRQVVLIWCSGRGSDGTFYADFTLEPGKTVYLVSNDGRTIIDSLAIPASLPVGMSVQKHATDLRQQCWEPEANPCIPSPSILNSKQDIVSGAEQMKERDPHGWILSITSVSVVFAALAILWFLFWLLFDRQAKKKAGDTLAPSELGMTQSLSSRGRRPRGSQEDAEVAAAIALALDMENSGEEYAAIATAVHLYLSDAVHDVEPGIVTIVRKDSGWNNKALNFRNLPK